MYRFYKRASFKDNKPYTIQKCTRMKCFEVLMSETEADYVVMSVLENFIVDAVGEDLTNGGDLVDQMIKDFGATLRATAERLPESKFALVMPLRRPIIAWFDEQMSSIRKSIVDMIKDLQMMNVVHIECTLSSTQVFESDGVHLTKDAGVNFVNIILDRSETFFDSESVDLTKEGENSENVRSTPIEDQSGLNRTNNRIERLEAEVREMKRTRNGDQLMFARLREDADFEKNKQKEDRLVINRLKVKNTPSDYKIRIDFFKKMAADLFESLIPGFTGKIHWISHGRINESNSCLSFLEVKLDCLRSAVDIRKAFVQKMRSKELAEEYEQIFITNCVTKSTRVRIDILKAIAKKLTNDKEAAFVSSFISRPVLQIKKIIQGEQTFPYKSFTFVEAVNRYRKEVDDCDLGDAYDRAAIFEAELEQNFLVLNSTGFRNRTRGRGQTGPRGGGYRGGQAGRGGRGGYGGFARGRGIQDGSGRGLGRGSFSSGFGSGNDSNNLGNNKRQMDEDASDQSNPKNMKK